MKKLNYEQFKKEIAGKFSDTEEVDGVFKPVEFSAMFSHDQVIKKQIDECVLPSELHKKEKEVKPFDNRFMSERMRKIMFLPVPK